MIVFYWSFRVLSIYSKFVSKTPLGAAPRAPNAYGLVEKWRQINYPLTIHHFTNRQLQLV
jgi:hypothetical protein